MFPRWIVKIKYSGLAAVLPAGFKRLTQQLRNRIVPAINELTSRSHPPGLAAFAGRSLQLSKSSAPSQGGR